MDRIVSARSFQDQGREYQLQAEGIFSGRDLLVLVNGGDKPHIGAVALASMVESPNIPQKQTTTPSVISAPGHKEYRLALAGAEKLSRALERTVAVAVGIHIDDITAGLIGKVEEEFNFLISDLVESILENRMK